MRLFKMGVLSLGLAVTVSAARSLPNIVVILSDDQGYADVSYSPHSPKVNTE